MAIDEDDDNELCSQNSIIIRIVISAWFNKNTRLSKQFGIPSSLTSSELLTCTCILNELQDQD